MLSATLVDDYAASAATTGSVAVGGSISGSIETTGDVDWIKVNLIAGTTYRFDLEGSDTGQGTLQSPRLQLLNSAGIQLLNDLDSGGYGGPGEGYSSQLIFTAPDRCGRCRRFDYGDPRPRADALTGLKSSSRLASPIGSTWRVALRARAHCSIRPCWVLDSNGLPLLGSQGGGELGPGPSWNSQLVFTANMTSTYYLQSVASDNSVGTYKISVTQLSRPDALDDAISIKEDTAPNPVLGKVLTNDQDADGDTLAVTNPGTFDLGTALWLSRPMAATPTLWTMPTRR